MKLNLKGKIALVTGGSYGLGRSIALVLAEEGCDIIICGKNIVNLKKTEKEISNFKVNVFSFSLDATREEEVKNLFSTVVKRIGRLDILINNVGGVEKFGSFFDLEREDWEKAFRLNFLTAVFFTREAVSYLKKSNQARIINISTVPALQPGLYNPHLSAAKAAMLNLNKYLANILARDNILVNAVCPGTLKGGAWEKNVTDRSKRLKISFNQAKGLTEEEEINKVPLGRIGTLEDVASLVVFLASSQASFITGTCINVDGGVVRSII